MSTVTVPKNTNVELRVRPKDNDGYIDLSSVTRAIFTSTEAGLTLDTTDVPSIVSITSSYVQIAFASNTLADVAVGSYIADILLLVGTDWIRTKPFYLNVVAGVGATP
jgi:hypothetical protein